MAKATASIASSSNDRVALDFIAGETSRSRKTPRRLTQPNPDLGQEA